MIARLEKLLDEPRRKLSVHELLNILWEAQMDCLIEGLRETWKDAKTKLAFYEGAKISIELIIEILEKFDLCVSEDVAKLLKEKVKVYEQTLTINGVKHTKYYLGDPTKDKIGKTTIEITKEQYLELRNLLGGNE